MEAPRFNTSWSKLDWILEAVSITGLIALVVLIAYSFNMLPQNIPTHYDVSGRPDAMNGKGSILILPVIAIFIYGITTLAPRLSGYINYPVRITKENTERQFTNMVTMLRVLKPVTVLIFLYITFAVIQNGLGNMDGLSVWFLPVTLASVFGTVGFFMIRAFALR